MNLGPGLYFFLSLVLTCVVSLTLALYARRHRETPGAGEFLWLSVSLFFLAAIEILSLFGRDAGQALFWFKARHVFTALIPVFFLRFALDYSRRKVWLSRRLWNALLLIPAITQILVWTND